MTRPLDEFAYGRVPDKWKLQKAQDDENEELQEEEEQHNHSNRQRRARHAGDKSCHHCLQGRRSVLERDVFGYGELGPWKSVKTFAKIWVAKNVRNTAEPVDLTWGGLTNGPHD